MSKTDAAQLIVGILVVLLLIALRLAGRTDYVAAGDLVVELEGGSKRVIREGARIPKELESEIALEQQRKVKRSWLAGITVGKDHRTSTSKTVAFAWTLALAFGFGSLLVAKLVYGVDAPWDVQINRPLQEEYLLLLGGPYAAAVLAKARTASQSEKKTDAPVGGASIRQLIGDDEDDTDLGDFQYLLFNALALVWFLGEVVGDMAGGFPSFPDTLTGLVLVSAGGYGAKKLIPLAAPTLASVVPAAQFPGGTIHLYGTTLVVPSSTEKPVDPTVMIGPAQVTSMTAENVLGNDRLTLTIPVNATPGASAIQVVRADGVMARTTTNVPTLGFTVLEPVPAAVTADDGGA